MYQQTNLSKTSQGKVISDLEEIAQNRKIVLICGEIPPEFCHRRIIDTWLSNSGYLVEELNY